MQIFLCTESPIITVPDLEKDIEDEDIEDVTLKIVVNGVDEEPIGSFSDAQPRTAKNPFRPEQNIQSDPYDPYSPFDFGNKDRPQRPYRPSRPDRPDDRTSNRPRPTHTHTHGDHRPTTMDDDIETLPYIIKEKNWVS